jgi:hypothetical protein
LGFLSKMLLYLSSIQTKAKNKKDARKLVKLLQDMYEPAEFTHQLIREQHESYKIGAKITAKLKSKSEIKKEQVDYSLRIQEIEKKAIEDMQDKWLSTGGIDEEMAAYLKTLSNEKNKLN